MPNTERDKYDEVALEIALMRYRQANKPRRPFALRVAEYLRSAFPPPAEDARMTVLNIQHALMAFDVGAAYSTWECIADAMAILEAFAQSRVKPWREALKKIASAREYTHWCMGCKRAVKPGHKHWGDCIPIEEAVEADDYQELIGIAEEALLSDYPEKKAAQ